MTAWLVSYTVEGFAPMSPVGGILTPTAVVLAEDFDDACSTIRWRANTLNQRLIEIHEVRALSRHIVSAVPLTRSETGLVGKA